MTWPNVPAEPVASVWVGLLVARAALFPTQTFCPHNALAAERGGRGSGLQVPERPVVGDAFLVGVDAVGVEQLALVAFAEIPFDTHRRDREVGPTVAHGEVAEIDVAGPLAGVGGQRVRGRATRARRSMTMTTSRASQIGGRHGASPLWRETCRVQLQFDPSDSADEVAFDATKRQLLEEFVPWAAARYGIDDGSLPADAETFLSWRFNYSTGDLTNFDRVDAEEFLLDWAPRKFAVGPEEARVLCRSVQAMVEFLAVTGRLVGGIDRAARVMSHVDGLIDDVASALGDRSNFGIGKSMMGIDLIGPDGNPLPDLASMLGSGELDLEQLQAVLDDRMAAFNALPLEERTTHTDPMFARPEPQMVELPFAYVPPPIEEVEAGASGSELLRLVDGFSAYVNQHQGVKLTGTGNLKIAVARHLVEVLDTGDELDVEHGMPRKTTSSVQLRWLTLVDDVAALAGAVDRLRTKINPNPEWSNLPLLVRAEAVARGLLEAGPLQSHVANFDDVRFAHRALLDDGIPHWLSRLLPQGSLLDFGDVAELADAVTEARFGSMSSTSGLPSMVNVRWLTELFEVLEMAGLIEWHDREETSGPYGFSTWVESGEISLTPLGRHVMPEHVRAAGYSFASLDDLDTADALTVVNAIATHSITMDEALRRWRVDTSTGQRAYDLASAALAAEVPEQRLVAFGLLDGLEPLRETAPAVRELLDSNCAGHAATFLVDHGLATEAEVDGFMTIGPIVDMLSTVIDDPASLDEIFRQVHAEAVDDLIDDLWRHDQPETIELLEALGRHLTDKALAKSARKAAIRHRSWLANQGR